MRFIYLLRFYLIIISILRRLKFIMKIVRLTYELASHRFYVYVYEGLLLYCQFIKKPRLNKNCLHLILYFIHLFTLFLFYVFIVSVKYYPPLVDRGIYNATYVQSFMKLLYKTLIHVLEKI